MRARGVVGVASWLALTAALVSAQTRDHLQCYRIDDPLAVRGVVDVDSPQLGLEPGCRLGRAKFLCDPAATTVVLANLPSVPVNGRGLLDPRICYRLHCAKPFPPAQTATDQFGTRALARLRPDLLCAPAVMGPPLPPMDGLDHLKCYRATDPARLRGVVNIDALHLGAVPGCEIGHGKLYCVPAATTLQQINVGPLLPIGGTGLDDDRVCYRLTCASPPPGPQLVSDRFGSRTVTDLSARLLCTPVPLGTTSTTTTVTTTSVTTTSFPVGADAALVCQRAIETGGMAYAQEVLDQLGGCMAPGGTSSIATCYGSAAVQQALDPVRVQWGAGAAPACAGVSVRSALGYPETCAGAPSGCTFASPVLDAPGGSNDVLDCLACRIKEQLGTSAKSFYADQDATEVCRSALGNGALEALRTTLQQLDACVRQPGVTSIAACFTPDLAAWRSQAETSCAGVNPYATLGYSMFCSGVGPVAPNSYAPHALPCSFNTTALTTLGIDNDLLDCLTCQTGEGVLGVGRDLFGVNLCCTGTTCNKVLTRYACRQAGGTPVRYRVDTVPGLPPTSAHGIDVGPDGTLYVTDDLSNTIVKRTPAGVVSVVGSTAGFPTGVAADAAGNVYVTNRCSHTVSKIPPGGVATVIAGTGVPGSTGDGGPATTARIVAPDGIAVDPAGNVYFTESGLLGFVCGSLQGSERVRMIDTAGRIHTVAGQSAGGYAGEGGPGPLAQLLLPYGLRWGTDGTLLVGEAGGQRVLRLDGAGILTRVAGVPLGPVGSHAGYGGPAAAARFYQNCGVATDPDGNILISPMEDNRIALVDSLGSVIAIAGTGEEAFIPNAGDGGPALLATVGLPEDVAVAPDGRVYFSDLLTAKVRVLTREPF